MVDTPCALIGVKSYYTVNKMLVSWLCQLNGSLGMLAKSGLQHMHGVSQEQQIIKSWEKCKEMLTTNNVKQVGWQHFGLVLCSVFCLTFFFRVKYDGVGRVCQEG